ncbi:MAG: acetyl-CoA carboxylase biotin carboxyl carrier protein subunit [Flavobacteriia bacterium]|nr:acetyl-CoA carboxylase biotin carboxyl carrier protein subunit [Flavobacteriia bacterium]
MMGWLFDKQETPTSKGASVTWIDHAYFILEFEGVSYHGEVLQDDSESQELLLKINHRTIHVRKKHDLDALIEQLGLDKPKVRKIKRYEAPMPGRVLQLLVEVGQAVEPGTALLSLEAMKMENTLKSNGIGTVKSITVAAGDVVEKGAVLFEFD